MENTTQFTGIVQIGTISSSHVTDHVILTLSAMSTFLCLCSVQRFCSWKAWGKFWWIQTGICFHSIVIPIFSLGILKLLEVSPLSCSGAMVTLLAPPSLLTCPIAAILDCDVTLAVVITMLITFISAGMMPLWIMNLKRFDSALNVLYAGHLPYDIMGIQLTSIMAVVLIASLLRWRKPQFAELLSNGAKPMAFLTALFSLSFYLYTILEPLPTLHWKEYLFCMLEPSVICFVCFVTGQYFRLDGSNFKVLALIFLVRGSLVCDMTFQRGLTVEDELTAQSTSKLLTIFSILFILIICLLNLLHKAFMQREASTNKRGGETSGWDVWSRDDHMIEHDFSGRGHHVINRPCSDVEESFSLPHYWSWV